MALQQGERYRCPDPNSGCEIEVTKAPPPGSGGQSQPALLLGSRDAAHLIPAVHGGIA